MKYYKIIRKQYLHIDPDLYYLYRVENNQAHFYKGGTWFKSSYAPKDIIEGNAIVEFEPVPDKIAFAELL